MCLAAIAINAHADWPLIVIANRDEFHARPTTRMQPWPDGSGILAGRDLQAGGTWLGLDGQGRLALLTNVRDPRNTKSQAPSRGHLAEAFLRSECQATDYLDNLAPEAQRYNGFNLVVVDIDYSAWHASNYQKPFYSPVAPGVHGLSNALMDTPWPKTHKTAVALSARLSELSAGALIEPDLWCDIMLDTTPVADSLLPDTGLSLMRERLLATPFIVSPDYGTRCTTLVLRHRTGACWAQEDSYNPQGNRVDRVRWQLQPGQPWCTTQVGPGNLNTA